MNLAACMFVAQIRFRVSSSSVSGASVGGAFVGGAFGGTFVGGACTGIASLGAASIAAAFVGGRSRTLAAPVAASGIVLPVLPTIVSPVPPVFTIDAAFIGATFIGAAFGATM